MAVIVPLPTRARTGSALQKSKSNIVEAHRKKVTFEFALERANSVCFTNCCRNTVPYDWPGHREGSVAKFRSCTWNCIIDAGRWAETNPSRIATARLYRTAEIIWALSSVDCEHHQRRVDVLELAHAFTMHTQWEFWQLSKHQRHTSTREVCWPVHL